MGTSELEQTKVRAGFFLSRFFFTNTSVCTAFAFSKLA
jgi:hypothetical protein